MRTALAYNQAAGGKIDTMYRDVLGRPGDLPGIQSWQGQLAGGTSLDQVRTALAYSNEARARIGDIYTQVLGRPQGVDPTSLAYWQRQLASGTTTLGDIRSAVAQSPEAAGQINAAYQNGMGRAATPGEITPFQDALASGSMSLSDVQSLVAYFGNGNILGQIQNVGSPYLAGLDATVVQGAKADVTAVLQQTAQAGASLLTDQSAKPSVKLTNFLGFIGYYSRRYE